MRACARLATERVTGTDGRGVCRVGTLRSQAPLMLRLTLPRGPEPWTGGAPDVPRVCLGAGAAGPLGGDELSLDVDVVAGSTLVLHDVSATLLLPGAAGDRSRTDVRIRVGAGGTLVWLPEPVIAAQHCRHVADVRVDLERGARLLLREELLLGRHGEEPGSVHQHLRIRLGGRALLHQHLAVGPGADGWHGPGVLGEHRAVGSLVAVDPAWCDTPPPAGPLEGDSAVLPLAGPAALVSALAPDGLALRRQLDSGLDLLTGGE